MNRSELLRESYMNYKKEKKKKVGRPVGSTNAAKKGGPKTNRTRHLALRVTEDLGSQVDQAAEETCRTASNWVEQAIYWALYEGAVKARQVVPGVRKGSG